MARVPVVCVSLGAIWTLLLLLAATTFTVYSGESTTMTGEVGRSTRSTSATLVQENGPWVLLVLSVPAVAVLLTAGLLALEPRSRWAGPAAWAPVACMGVLTLVSILSIGIVLVPVTVLLGIAVLTATLDRRSASRSSDRGGPSATPQR